MTRLIYCKFNKAVYNINCKRM